MNLPNIAIMTLLIDALSIASTPSLHSSLLALPAVQFAP